MGTDPLEPEASPTVMVESDKRTMAWRLVLGFFQGVALYLLSEAAKRHAWPATDGFVFVPLLLTISILPPMLVTGFAHMGLRRLLLWTAGLGLVVALLAHHDVWRAAEGMGTPGNAANPFPSPLVSFFSVVLVFIAYSLIRAGEADQRWWADYETYFDTAWKLAVQLQFSALFVGAFWAVLWMGAGLFQLIGLDFLRRLLMESWFFLPATATAFAAALHLTDVKPGMVRSIRNLLLTLQSWLLPLLTLIFGGFVASVPFTGLDTLWKTRHAAALLLGAAATLVILINTAYQQGRKGEAVTPILRYSARLACGLLLPVVAMAAYAVWLRVDQYGFTTDRVIAVACVVVASCYALGYGWAALQRGEWLAPVAVCNVLTSYVVLAVLFALFTSVADPARLATNSQLVQLADGRISAEKFDFAYLRFQTARYGREALEKLSRDGAGPEPARVRERATQALALKNRWDRSQVVLTQTDVQTNVRMRTPGTLLPADFIATRWQDASAERWMLPNCLTTANAKCDAYSLDLSGSGKGELLLLPEHGMGAVLARDDHAEWHVAAQLPFAANCPSLREALAANSYRLIAPTLRDIEVNGQRIRLQSINTKSELCKPNATRP